MVPKPFSALDETARRFRAVLFRMVPKLNLIISMFLLGFRAVLFRMVPKHD